MPERKLTVSELDAARNNRRAGEASLACEGLELDEESTHLFDKFEAEKLSHAERRRQLMEFHRLKAREE